MDAAGDEKEAEILRSLLAVSRMQNPQITEIHYWPDDSTFSQQSSQQQIIWQIDPNDPTNIVQQIPVTYVTSSGKNFEKPMTYVVSENIITDNQKQLMDVTETQKILLKHDLEPTLHDVENFRKVYKINEGCQEQLVTETDTCLEVVLDVENNNTEVVESVNVEATTSKLTPQKRKAPQTPRKTQSAVKVTPSKQEQIGRKINSVSPLIDVEDKGGKKKPGRKKVIKRKGKPLNKNGKTQKITKPKAYSNTAVKLKMKSNKDEDMSEREERHEDDDTSVFKASHYELTKLEDNAEEVAERFKIGCECETNCFDGLSPDKVFRHRLNIADLTKSEHDMYLMGVIMASIQNPEETCRRKERIRIRSSYAYQGKKICLTAFLYLEHVTLYQMKRLRKHLRYHGVSPRIHGNYGRKPANTLSLDIYQHATQFVQNYISQRAVKCVPNFTTISPARSQDEEPGKKLKKYKIANKMTSYHLPPECKKKTVHDEYKKYCEGSEPQRKVMKYTTFTSFLKKQFPNVKFQKPDVKKTEEKYAESKPIEELEKQKNKKQRAKILQVENMNMPLVAKCVQIPSTYVMADENIQISPSPVIITQKPGLYNKGQIVNGQMMKTSQVVLNPVQYCSATGEVQNATLSDIRIQNQVFMGNQIHTMAAPPTYTQHVYTMQNVNEIEI